MQMVMVTDCSKGYKGYKDIKSMYGEVGGLVLAFFFFFFFFFLCIAQCVYALRCGVGVGVCESEIQYRTNTYS